MEKYKIKMPHWPKPIANPPFNPAIRVRKLLAKLGNPELKLPPLIHVGGTKGKGSTLSFLQAMLESAGYKVHVYSSPHLARFNERILLAGREISDDELYEFIEQVRIATGDDEVGFFDATTAAAVLAFANNPADILLMEMGLGGAVDATNIIDNPLLTIITSISYDHQEHMGETLEEITAFEAGILKPGVNCVVSPQEEPVLAILQEKAAEIGSPLYIGGQHWVSRKYENAMIFADSYGSVTLPLPNMLGEHQIINAGNAIAAITALEDFEVDEGDIIAGLANANRQGRLQRLYPNTLAGNFELWFDGGHNPAAALAIADFAEVNWQDKPLYLLFGTTQGKDLLGMLQPFVGLAEKIYAVEVKSEPKSYKPEKIVETLKFVTNLKVADSLEDAIKEIAGECGDFRVLIFGSLYLWLESASL